MPPRTRKSDPHAYQARRNHIRAVRFVLDSDTTCGNIEQVFEQLGVTELGYGTALATFRGQFASASIRTADGTEQPINPGDWVIVDDTTVHVLPDHEFHRRYEAQTA